MSRNYIQHYIPLVAALLLMVVTPWLTACQSGDSEELPPVDVAQYINLTVTVSRGSTPTRAIPNAGEDGDGREMGFKRENKVSGITVILYQDEDGINTTADTKIDFAAYYPTFDYPSEDSEIRYTTGDQLLASSSLDLGNTTYHAIIVANKDLTARITAGTTTVKAIRDMVMREQLYSGTESYEATDFMMSSEADCELSPKNAEIDKTDPSHIYYRYTNAIRIERLAARIDYWTAGSNGYKEAGVNGDFTYVTPGYEYPVMDGETETEDRFVVTGITPFNLNSYNTTNGGTYLIKRLAPNITVPLTMKYLVDETGSNYVIDPATINKTDGEMTYFLYPLSQLDPTNAITHSGKPYYRSMTYLKDKLSSTGGTENFPDPYVTKKPGDNLIIAYPQENTLWGASVLYNYATGLAIEGDYYRKNDGTTEHHIYYGYLRHNGTSSSAYSAKQSSDLSKTETSTSGNAMEFGIVRNNIYRVYISKINKVEMEEVTLTLNIKVKKWDTFIHKTIYM